MTRCPGMSVGRMQRQMLIDCWVPTLGGVIVDGWFDARERRPRGRVVSAFRRRGLPSSRDTLFPPMHSQLPFTFIIHVTNRAVKPERLTPIHKPSIYTVQYSRYLRFESSVSTRCHHVLHVLIRPSSRMSLTSNHHATSEEPLLSCYALCIPASRPQPLTHVIVCTT